MLDEESDALLKINDVFIKIQNTNTLDVKTCPQSCLLFVFGQVMKAIAVHFVHERSAERRIRDQSPPNTTPARRESSAVTVKTELQSGRFTRELHRFNV